MAGSNKKMAVLLVYRYLIENTNEKKGATNREISDYLSREYGISQEDKTITDHIRTINDAMKGMSSVVTRKTGNVNYYSIIGSSSFNISDAVLLVTSLYGNRSISLSDAENISEKILANCSKADKRNILDSIIKSQEVRSESDIYEENYAPLRDITDAIVDRHKISIEYMEFPISQPYKVKSHNISPYRLLSRNGSLYLLAKCDEHKSNISKFRVDRIIGVNEGKGEYVCEKKTFTAEDEARINKSMAIGHTITAVLEFNSSVEKVVFDRYGRDAHIQSSKNGITRISVEEVLSDSLLSWLFLLGENVKIIGCEELKTSFREKVESVWKMINNENNK